MADEKNTETVSDLSDLKEIAGDAPAADAAEIAQNPAAPLREQELDGQIVPGIATVLSGVELWVAAAHQLVGALLVAATAWAMHSYGLMRSPDGAGSSVQQR